MAGWCAFANPDDPHVNGDPWRQQRGGAFVSSRASVSSRAMAVQSEFLTENGHINSIQFDSIQLVPSTDHFL